MCYISIFLYFHISIFPYFLWYPASGDFLAPPESQPLRNLGQAKAYKHRHKHSHIGISIPPPESQPMRNRQNKHSSARIAADAQPLAIIGEK